LELGSDVPFFVLDFHQAWVSEYGNAVRQIKNKLAKYVLFPTEHQVSTEEIFQLLEKDKNYKSRVDAKKCFASLTLGTFDRNLIYNDLTPYILAHNKKIADAYNKMLTTKNIVISGSGGSLVEVKPNVLF
jgi:4-diphosphocytidyl-2C-methyl-D-erythritol kinase